MTHDHRDDERGHDEAAIDDELRRVMGALARSAPEPPPLPAAGARPSSLPAGPERRPWLAVAAVLALVAGGVTWAVVARRDVAQPVSTEAVSVAHQRVRWTQETELSCAGGAGAGPTTAEIEVWVDLVGDRIRQRIVYADGAERERIWEGLQNRPERKFERGSSSYVEPTCPGWGRAAVDDAEAVMGRLIAPPLEPSPGDSSADRRSIVAGAHTDDLGRVAEVQREETDGMAQPDDGTTQLEVDGDSGVPFHQTTEWYTEPGTGRLLQSTYRTELEGVYRVTSTMVITSDEDEVTVDPDLFDPDGFELVYETPGPDGRHVTAEPVEPATVAVGPDRYWPPEPVP